MNPYISLSLTSIMGTMTSTQVEAKPLLQELPTQPRKEKSLLESILDSFKRSPELESQALYFKNKD